MGELIEGSLVGSEGSPGVEGSGDEIDLDDWVSGGDDVEARLLKIAKQMERDALLIPIGSPVRATMLKDSAAIFGRLLDKQKPNADKGGGLTVAPGGRGGVAVAQIGRDDAVGSYMRMLEGPPVGDE